MLCNKIEKFDHHQKGLCLSDYLTIKMAEEISKSNSLGIKTVEHTVNSTPEKFVQPIPSELDAMQEFSRTRQQIKEAIGKYIQIDEFDTKDCNEIRLEVEGARKWLKNKFDISYTKIHSKDWRADKKENTLLAIAALTGLLDDNGSNAKTADKIVEYLNHKGMEKDKQAFEKLISEATEVIKQA